MTAMESIFVECEGPLRLDSYLSKTFPAYSRSYFQSLIESHLVILNGQPAKKRLLVQAGDKLDISFRNPKPLHIKSADIPLEILYEDDDLIAINKPSGLVVHPAPGHYDQTLVNALYHHLDGFKAFDEDVRPGIIHRLDKDTSGVILCAKNPWAQKMMSEAFANRQIDKQYIALCHNHPTTSEVNKPIKRHFVKRKEMMIRSDGKPAKTVLKTLALSERYSLILAKPITGRTHQIRVHLQSIQCPIVSDPIYGKFSKEYPRLMLHAVSLSFIHPRTEKRIKICAQLDPVFQTFFNQYNKRNLLETLLEEGFLENNKSLELAKNTCISQSCTI